MTPAQQATYEADCARVAAYHASQGAAPAPEHAILAPSSAAEWAYCPAAPSMQRRYPQPDDSPASMEGTAAHWAIPEMLAGRIVPVGSLAPNGIAITQDMIDGAEMFVSEIPDAAMRPGGSLICERRVGPGAIHPECWGTPDARWVDNARRPVALVMSNGVLCVADYKYGHGYVDAWRNWQLICYVAELLHVHPQFVEQDILIRLGICQPRCYTADGPWRWWEIRASELQAFIETLREAATRAMADNPQQVAGEHCRYCSARVHCEAFQQLTGFALHTIYGSDVRDMPPVAMATMRRVLSAASGTVKAMLSGLDDEIEAALRKGIPIRGYALESGRGKLEWSVPVGEVVALGQMFGVELGKQGCLTPTQAKKLIGDADVLAGYTVFTAGALKVVESDGVDVSGVFGKGGV